MLFYEIVLRFSSFDHPTSFINHSMTSNFKRTWARSYKTLFFMLNSAENKICSAYKIKYQQFKLSSCTALLSMKFLLLINVKMLTTELRMKNSFYDLGACTDQNCFPLNCFKRFCLLHRTGDINATTHNQGLDEYYFLYNVLYSF